MEEGEKLIFIFQNCILLRSWMREKKCFALSNKAHECPSAFGGLSPLPTQIVVQELSCRLQ